jgi:hypothetical protein
MRKITKQAAAALFNGEKFNSGNTSVEILPNVSILRLFGNAIAYRYNDEKRTLSITNAGWQSNTTKERLNGLPGVYIRQDKRQWYLNGQVWDGEWTKI